METLTTEDDLGPQHPMSQVKCKYKISLKHEAAINFLSLTVLIVKYSHLFGNFLGSSFRLLSNNTNNSLTINLDSPPINRSSKSIIAKKKNAQKKAKLAAVIEKKAATMAKKAEAAKIRKVQAVARSCGIKSAKIAMEKNLQKRISNRKS